MQPNQPGLEVMAWITTAILVIAFLARFGRSAVEWVLMKLYELFIR